VHILFIGGTHFVGRAMAEAALERNHKITLLHRTPTTEPIFADVEHVFLDRNGDLSSLSGRSFDATIDVCAYVPSQVKRLAAALGGRGGHHVFVSTMSVFAEADGPGIDEQSPLVTLDDPTTEEVNGETYGGLKVLCEQAAAAAYGDALTVIRPTYVIGPHDHTGRFTWWVRRIVHGGEVVAPGPRDAPVQAVDARDQGDWTIRLVEDGTVGTFNSVAPTPPFGFGDLLDATVSAVGPQGTTLTWVDAAWLRERGESYQSLPLWTGGTMEWTLAGDPTKAYSAGLSPRPLTETIVDTWRWINDARPPMVPGWGTPEEREAKLLSDWHASS